MFALYIYSTGHIQCLAKIIIIKNKKIATQCPLVCSSHQMWLKAPETLRKVAFEFLTHAVFTHALHRRSFL